MGSGDLVTLDNTRVLAASLTDTPVQATVFDEGDLIPEDQAIRFVSRSTGDLPTTWGDAVMKRIGNQNQLYQSTYPLGSPITGLSDSGLDLENGSTP